MFFNDLEKLIILNLLEENKIDNSLMAELQDVYAKLPFSWITENCNELDFMIMRKIFNNETYRIIQDMIIRILKEKVEKLEKELKSLSQEQEQKNKKEVRYDGKN